MDSWKKSPLLSLLFCVLFIAGIAITFFSKDRDIKEAKAPDSARQYWKVRLAGLGLIPISIVGFYVILNAR